jgi:hypothetical protein
VPFTGISLRRGKPLEYLAAISDSLHQALVEAFRVPPADRFQVFHQLDPGELVFDRGYLGGPRSDNFLHFTITTGWSRPTATGDSWNGWRRRRGCGPRM